MSETSLFFAVGSPRSGTAWLANAMNSGTEAYCFHECERDLIDGDVDRQIDIVQDRMEHKPHWYVGNSSSGMLFWGQFHAPLVIIHRDWDEVEHSLRMAMLEWGQESREWSIEPMKEGMDRLCSLNPEALQVDFKDLFQAATLDAIWRHCMPCMLPPHDRFQELVRMRVTMKDWEYPEPMPRPAKEVWSDRGI